MKRTRISEAPNTLVILDCEMMNVEVAPATDTCYRLLATVMHHGRTTENGQFAIHQ